VPGARGVRVVVAGAAPPSKTIERIEAELGWEFIQIYGLTETSPLLTINRAPQEWEGIDRSERARRLSRAGVPAVGVRMAVDENGEILTRTNNVLEGYWNQPEATAKALVVLRTGTQASAADLIAFCRTRMAHYKCPTSVELRDALARTATGKLQKFKLREPYWAGRERKVN